MSDTRVVGRIEKSHQVFVRVSVEHFEGHPQICVRTERVRETGDSSVSWGISVSPHRIDALIKLLVEARKEARAQIHDHARVA